MIQETTDLLGTLERLTGDLVRAVTEAGAGAMGWRPDSPETNSPAAIATHALGASRHWVVSIVGGESDDRDREAEFRAEAQDIADVQERADQWLADARRILEPMSTADLDGPCRLPVTRDWMSSLTARGSILHAIEHLGMHIGHLELTLQLWTAQKAEAGR
ncbi:MAG TPA: DinB family protein [Dehalococcoidia bacterium]|nr:DinB family protein [Dehalococcoidia bacterium]